MIDSLLVPLLVTALQIGAASADSYTTELCFEQGKRNCFVDVYESNRMYSIPFGEQPTIKEFIVANIILSVTMYGVGWIIRKTPARDWWFIPQVTIIGAQAWQSKSNWNLYQKLKREP
jgi:hypothetical protein